MHHIIAFLLFMVVASPLHAQSTNLQAELNALLAQLAALQAQLGTGAVSPTPQQAGTGSCPQLYRALRSGMSGSDVAALQAFLASDRTLYPDGTVSGYFGALTQRAVQLFQARHGIANGGSPDSTGYGAVGPATRNAIAALCRSSVPQVPVTSCTLGGITIASGATQTFYSVMQPPAGASCAAYAMTRQCVNGYFSGNAAYQYASCGTNAPSIPGSCTIDGETILNGQTRSLFRRDQVPFGSQCETASRTCSNGVLAGPSDYRYTACNVPSAPAACTLDGRTISHGSSATFYKQKNILFGQNCTAFSATRTCENGDFSGDNDYRYATCSAAGAKSCTVVAVVDGKTATTTVAHGGNKDFWSRESVAYTTTCDAFKLNRICNDGVLTGATSYKFPSCEIIPEKSCTIDGVTVAGGATRTFYTARTNANCAHINQARKCNNGVLSGAASYQYAYCAPVGQRYCLLDGVYVAHNASRSFFSTENAVFGADCSQFSQSRKCTDGTLSGSATYSQASCKNSTGTSCVIDGKTIVHGMNATLYSTRTAPSGDACAEYGQVRNCVNGSLSGSPDFKYKECSASTSDIGSQNQVAAALTALEALLKDALAQLDSWF